MIYYYCPKCGTLVHQSPVQIWDIGSSTSSLIPCPTCTCVVSVGRVKEWELCNWNEKGGWLLHPLIKSLICGTAVFVAYFPFWEHVIQGGAQNTIGKPPPLLLPVFVLSTTLFLVLFHYRLIRRIRASRKRMADPLYRERELSNIHALITGRLNSKESRSSPTFPPSVAKSMTSEQLAKIAADQADEDRAARLLAGVTEGKPSPESKSDLEAKGEIQEK